MVNKNIFSLDGKTAVVIGGAGGIGKGIALGMSQAGARLIIASRKLTALEETAQEITSVTGNEVHVCTVDVADESSMQSLVAFAEETFGKVDMLVNSSGLNIKCAALEYPMDDFDTLFDVNVKGTMVACKIFGQHMKAQGGGSIVNLSSVRGIRGYGGGNTAYCGTKGAVELMTKALAIELAQYNIRVNALGPALVITPGTVHIKNNPELAEKYRATVPLGRIGEAEDMVGATVFLSSEAASFVTGQTIFVDGGLTAG
jgi:NAD(P)-dependent dehydrogenase (short-subunit alcohol dehydrogenase family)